MHTPTPTSSTSPQSSMTPSPTRGFRPRASPPGTSWEDLTSSLTWPRLLVAPRFARRPLHIFFGLLALASIAVADQLPGLFTGSSSSDAISTTPSGPLSELASRAQLPLHDLWQATLSLDLPAMAFSLQALLITLPISLFKESPVVFLLSVILALTGYSLFTGAISRGVALSYGRIEHQRGNDLVRFALSRVWSLASVCIIPLGIAIMLMLAVAAFGWVTLSFPWLQAAGALFFPIILLLSLLSGLILISTCIVVPLLIPAIASEGTDALDGCQRVFAYTIANAPRLVLYLLISFLRALPCLLLALLIAYLVRTLALTGASHWISEPFAQAIRDQSSSITLPGASTTTSQSITLSILRFWTNLPLAIAGGYAISLFTAATTATYLAMRRMIDGQDMGEIWLPGTPAGTYDARVGQDSSDDESQ